MVTFTITQINDALDMIKDHIADQMRESTTIALSYEGNGRQYTLADLRKSGWDDFDLVRLMWADERTPRPVLKAFQDEKNRLDHDKAFSPLTAVVGREGNVDIRGVCCRTAVGVYEAEINITSDYNSTAICACAAINVTGNHNKIAVVGCSPTISCTGTDNNIISFGPYTTFSGTAGNCITVADYNYERRVTGFVTGWIGENGLKENVRYRVRKGQFVEVTS